MKTKIAMLCLILSSWGAYAQHEHAAKKEDKKTDKTMVMFKDAKLGIAYEHYLHVKDALVASNSSDAKKGASELQKALKDIDASAAAMEASSKIAASSDLNEQRKTFSTLSNEMTTLVKGEKLSTGMVYLEYCPMANGNMGAYWLSNEKQIKNPYFGDMMLTCGSVKEIIH
ncbi:MAG TPA: DUF3347 domain-containing protein [Cyclobacteriaceae bacterium]